MKKTGRKIISAESELIRVAFMSNPEPISLNRAVGGEFVEVNEAFCALTGLTRENIIGKSSREIGMSVDLALREEIINLVNETGKVVNLEFLFKTKEGKITPCLLLCNTAEIGGEKFLVCVTRERSIMSSAGEEDLPEFNEHLVEMIGYDREELAEVKTAHLVESGSGHQNGPHNNQKNTDKYRIEAIKKDGTAIVLDVSGMETFYHGRTVRMLSIMDVTGKKEMEDALRKSSQLAIIGRIASGIAHEINNPLATISASNEAIMARIPGLRKIAGDETDINTILNLFDDYHSIIKHEVERSGRIIQDLLSLAKFGEYNMKPVDVEKLVESTIHLLEIQSRMKDYLFKSITDEEIPHVIADSDRLRQVLIILLTNAVDSMESGGLIEIVTRFDSEAEKIFLSVIDQGAGFENIEPKRIFEPFYTTKGSRGGTGLGLSIAESIIERHDGEIKVEANRERGATFTISLPASVAKRTTGEGMHC